MCFNVTYFQTKQTFIDIGLRPGRARNSRRSVAHQPGHATSYGPLRPNVTSSIKPEVHNVAQRCRRRTEPQPQGIRIQNFVPIGPAVPKICSRADRQTDRQTEGLIQWRGYRGFRRFNEPGPLSSCGPRAPSHKNFTQENN